MDCALKTQQEYERRLQAERQEVLRLQRKVEEHKGITDYIGGLKLRIVPENQHAAYGFNDYLLTVRFRPEAYGHAFMYAQRNFHDGFRDVGHYVHLIAEDVRRQVGKVVSETLSKMSEGMLR